MGAFIIQIDVENPEYLDHFFMDKQEYSVCPTDGEVIIGESQKTGFQPIKYQQNADGSNTLILERWNNKM